MMISASGARAMWCPFARAWESDRDGSYVVAATNRDSERRGAPRSSTMCVAAECMAWRWSDVHAEPNYRARVHREDLKAVTEPPRPADVPADWIWTPYDEENEVYEASWAEPGEQAEGRFERYRQGYCGLAGRPGVL